MPPVGGRVPVELAYEIEQFLFHEAELLDTGCYHDWLALLASDVRYIAPTRTTRSVRNRPSEVVGENHWFDEDALTLALRVGRLDSPTAWAEQPASRTRRLVTNVRATATAVDGEYEVRSNVLLYRNRLERDTDLFAGRRHDLLRRRDAAPGWEIVRREVLLDQNVLTAKNLSVFF